MTPRRLSLALALALVFAACGDTPEVAPAPTTTAAPETAAAPTTTTTTEPTGTATPAATPQETSSTPAVSGVQSAAALSLGAALKETTLTASGRMEGSFDITVADGSLGVGELTMPFSGAWDNNADSFAFAMDMSGIAAIAGAEVPDFMADLFGELEIRQIGDTAYMRYPLFTGMFGVGTEWLEMPADDSASTVSGFATMSPTNPTDLLAFLEGANADVTEVGPDTVRGVATTRYRVTFDIEKLLEVATPEQQDQFATAGPLPLDELPMDIWIGGDGLVYRYSIDVDGSGFGADLGAGFSHMTMTFEMWDWGESIAISPPPADEVTSAEDLVLFDPGLFDSSLFDA